VQKFPDKGLDIFIKVTLDISEESTFWGQDLELSPEVWIILVMSVVIFWILLAIFLACFCGPNFIECQLCEQQVIS